MSKLRKNHPYWKALREMEVRTIRPTKSLIKEDKPIMQGIVNDIKKVVNDQKKLSKFKIVDFSTTMPPKLYKRVRRILPSIIPIEEDTFDEINPDAPGLDDLEKVEKPSEVFKIEKEFSESTWSFVEKLEETHPVLDTITKTEIIKKVKKTNENWQSEYICKSPKGRCKWNSKYLVFSDNFAEKSFMEQAEILMDQASERFSNWVSTLSPDPDSDISKEFLQKLFSVGRSSALDAVVLDPKIIKAVPKTVAHTWKVPQMALETNVIKMNNEVRAGVPKNPVKYAFGNILPLYLRPWVPKNPPFIIEPNFPEQLRTFEYMFNGIGHLTSVKKFAQHYIENPHLTPPEYLQTAGILKEHTANEDNISHTIPLFELFKCEY